MLQSLPNDEQYRLRAFLFKKNAPMLIATSTGLYEGFADYRMPFYDAFRVFHIPELEHEDLADILPKKEYEAVRKDEFFLDVMPKLRGNLNYICTLAIALQSCNSVDVAIQSVIAQKILMRILTFLEVKTMRILTYSKIKTMRILTKAPLIHCYSNNY